MRPVGRRAQDIGQAAFELRGLLKVDPPDVVVANGVKAAAAALPAAVSSRGSEHVDQHDVSKEDLAGSAAVQDGGPSRRDVDFTLACASR